MTKVWEIYGIRHAENRGRVRGQNFILESEPEAPLPLDFYSWLLRCGDEVIVVDTGMDPAKAAKHGHNHLLSPVDALRTLGVEAAEVETVILTHAHYDHLGFLDAFPAARFHMQAAEMDYVTGPWMMKPWFRRAYEVDEITRLVQLLHGGRLDLHGREARIAEGVTVHWVGGHCAGQEIVRVRTARGWVVLASDALHYYEEYARGVPFAVVYSSAEMIAAHDVIRALADSDSHVLPAHDPQMVDLFPAVAENILRLDVAPDARGWG
ncbi:N-acyl homoserine lactonase family protein [Maritimibacter alkaliphilus]|uniref:N-acyl homoserine lactonase family protein n=1 Tax=Maritimibacter alkaliphilus TaxID=404236 RepID=UPI001C96FAEC|nr:N-acyl homoserine lactonase family protein [Maritimibacter alkaliphilus]MBY6092562.1 N-acyl homoserine lactonase family protein [Maritimibacter alkaliphilus]